MALSMAAPATPTPRSPQQLHTPNGTWKHPQFDEITRRQYATTFDEHNVKVVVANAGLLAASFLANAVTAKVKLLDYAAAPVNALLTHVPYSDWAVLALRLFFAVNVVSALLPLVRRYYPDDIVDIPLTPSQRSSMGLKPSASATPGSAYASPAYVTPPRYSRSTPRSSFSAHGDRPLLGSGSPGSGLGRSASGASYSPGLSGSANRRSSYGGASPFNSSLFGDSAASSGPGTPTPATGKASVGLNNKWLYEKRRDSPRSGMFA
ncbi:nuclear pore complex component-domain-containing protein [Boeremia exigua]|uniref:nuclear pore complex component-domain-containing protein n=1 Tax=Boeremia exigua TaxID=749465 RepID=UPI001E8E1003|nr:nuclear pore complex component-domain-containing protein [Boeremia exigua]KAH6638822.1 nuclear pore complex component-domain-containing protein [Boeremia exigua]